MVENWGPKGKRTWTGAGRERARVGKVAAGLQGKQQRVRPEIEKVQLQREVCAEVWETQVG